MRKDGIVAKSLFCESLCAPLAHADPVPIAAGREAEAPALISDRETGAAQTQSTAQRGSGNTLSADRKRRYVPRAGWNEVCEPLFRRGKVGGDTKAPCEHLLNLRFGEGEGVLVVVGRQIGAAVHRDEIGERRAPYVLARFGLPVGDGKIARSGG